MSKFQTVKRPDFSKLPEFPLPLYVRSTGIFQLDPFWHGAGGDDSPFVQIFWGVEGSGVLKIGEEDLRLGVGDVAIMLQGESHRYFAGSAPWTLRWLTFDGAGASSFMRSYGYPRLGKALGPCPVQLFEELESALRTMTPFSQRRLISIATQIIALAGGRDDDGSKHGRLASRFVELAQTNYPNGAVNVNSLSDILGVHRSTLSRVFKERMLISPSEYLERLRMQHALSLLRESERSVSEIAELSGIPDRSFFCRCVRKATGMSPRAYRESSGSKP